MKPRSSINHKRGISRKVICGVALCLMLCLVLWGTKPAGGEVFDQYQVKSVFLFNLTNFIDWPAAGNPDVRSTFTIGILGADPFNGTLGNVVKGEKAKGRSITIQHFTSLDALNQHACNLLFINGEMLHIWPQIRAIARSRGILTASDVKGFCGRGGMVNLIVSAGKIIIEININEARRNGFDVSAKLLNVARITTGGKEN